MSHERERERERKGTLSLSQDNAVNLLAQPLDLRTSHENQQCFATEFDTVLECGQALHSSYDCVASRDRFYADDEK